MTQGIVGLAFAGGRELLRECRRCGKQAFTPQDLEVFTKNSWAPHGRRAECKPCAITRLRESDKKKSQSLTDNERCNDCSEVLQTGLNWKTSVRARGRTVCNVCEAIREAKKRSVKHGRSFTLDEAFRARYTGHCELTGLKIANADTDTSSARLHPMTLSIHRKDSSIGYTNENSIYTVWAINNFFSDFNEDQYQDLLACAKGFVEILSTYA